MIHHLRSATFLGGRQIARFEINEVVLRGGGEVNRSPTQGYAAGMFPSGSGRMHK